MFVSISLFFFEDFQLSILSFQSVSSLTHYHSNSIGHCWYLRWFSPYHLPVQPFKPGSIEKSIFPGFGVVGCAGENCGACGSGRR
jgi:hypothetical protein